MTQFLDALIFFGVPALVITGLAWPARRKGDGWSFFRALCVVIVGMAFPLFVFTGSLFLTPNWKGGCTYGWIDCLHEMKLMLSPFVLWALAAFYAVEVLRVKWRTDLWIVLGVLYGAITSTAFLIHGLLTMGIDQRISLFLLVPLYVSVWFCLHALELMRDAAIGLITYVIALLGMAPFWMWAAKEATKVYSQLPDTPPNSCFVVTAAARGHQKVVGTLTPFVHGNKTVPANRQLRVFWEFEERWKSTAPLSHRHFRSVYNRVGPMVARQIRSPWAADIVYVALKPLEWWAARY